MSDPTTKTGDDRLDRFDAALEQIGHRASGNDRRWALAGLGAMALGVVVAVAAYVTSTNQTATGDVIEAVVLGLVGVCLVVSGAAVFVRFSLTEFLRFWMLRMLLQESGTDTSKDR
ncbi:hypothetical protein [Actinospongicola halichondriae]|uniref:hypothetical protein n=1 Tax=Actinospongicola halichondriae TaxID=3236844 RepID=UPI003D594938